MSVRVLKLERISKAFGRLRALDDVSVEFTSGCIIGIVGPNGCGKTTLLDVMSGFQKPDRGRVLLADGGRYEEVSELTQTEIARRGLVRTFQRVSCPRLLAVQECVRVALDIKQDCIHGARKKKDGASQVALDSTSETSVMDVLERFGLVQERRTLTGELSVGQRKQVDLACAFARSPVIAFLDEPFCALAPRFRECLRLEMRDLKRRGGVIVFVEHDLQEVQRWADVVHVMKAGRIERSGSPREVLRRGPSPALPRAVV